MYNGLDPATPHLNQSQLHWNKTASQSNSTNDGENLTMTQIGHCLAYTFMQKHTDGVNEDNNKLCKELIASASAFIGVLGALALVGLWKILSHWGGWRVSSPENGVDRQPFIRVWYGWIEREEYDRQLEKREARTEARKRMLAFKSTYTDYNTIFWDPDGSGKRDHYRRRDESLLRHLPGWMRSRRSDANQSNRLEAGTRNVPNLSKAAVLHPHKSSAGKRHLGKIEWAFDSRIPGSLDFARPSGLQDDQEQGLVPTEEGQLLPRSRFRGFIHYDGSALTVRRAKTMPASMRIWNNNSEELDRALHHQLSLPNISFCEALPDVGTGQVKSMLQSEPHWRPGSNLEDLHAYEDGSSVDFLIKSVTQADSVDDHRRADSSISIRAVRRPRPAVRLNSSTSSEWSGSSSAYEYESESHSSNAASFIPSQEYSSTGYSHGNDYPQSHDGTVSRRVSRSQSGSILEEAADFVSALSYRTYSGKRDDS
ncbi:hypothetical protein MMC25_005363 [Agyrium rufum]|nr:hypothetical protein [Agyrium rufum]